MNLQNQMRNPIAWVPVAMLFLVIGILFPMIVHPVSQVAKNWAEGIRGLFFGISFGINIMALVLQRRAKRKAAC